MKGVLLILVVLLAAGCSHVTPQLRGVTGSKSELHGSDFDGQMLNEAGRGKIDALPADGPVVLLIHMSRAVDRHVYVRRAREVRAYAKDRGLPDAQVRFDQTYADDAAVQQPFMSADAMTACVADDNR